VADLAIKSNKTKGATDGAAFHAAILHSDLPGQRTTVEKSRIHSTTASCLVFRPSWAFQFLALTQG